MAEKEGVGMALVGADVEQLRELARAFTQAADRLDGTTGEVTGRLSSTSWVGPDANRYRAQWQGQSMASMRGVVSALRLAAATIERNAREQDSASAANGFGSPTHVGPAGGSVPGGRWTDRLSDLLTAGGIANDIAKEGGAGFHGVTGGVIDGAGWVTSGTSVVEGYATGDRVEMDNGGIGLVGSALGTANPELGIAAGAAQLYADLTLPTSNSDIDATYNMGSQSMFGKPADQLTPTQVSQLNSRYDGIWGVANMISDSMDSKAAGARQFFAGLVKG
jgi:hypothetical protein